ncbi:GDP-mannose 4,6-dehydratase [Brevibacillus composti]|uniref:GDP-mannose 4,6-dehydratase n=1 Tax=Brevibacillus composti TaxID=2796470 RepID=A0A7T5JQK9_9BACL|nr:NAD-dependent epimerase/dehydratase family protein [Brevibacillus composti]QQE76367.1 GDP-mannose 4,6-dehydratase [Brevibacillus composti]QUO43394.1 GDP-mannose 4,6-dehydratase [Brevibacillus composti]
MRKVLITGCAGFIGSHLAERLLQDGMDVIGIDGFVDNYDASVKLRNLSAIRSHPRFAFHSSLLADKLGEPWLDEVDLIFHQAALPGVRSSWGTAFADYVAHNLTATQSLLEACTRLQKPPRIVIASSSSVYGSMKEGALDESAPLHPVSPYGVTKAAMEQICRVYVEAHGLHVVMLRYFTVYGPRQRPDMAFHRFFRQMLRGEPITIYGDGQQSRDFTYVSDAVEANLLAARHAAPGDVFNIGGDREISVLEVLHLMSQLANVTPHVVHLPAVAGDSRRTKADIRQAQAKLGYQPRVRLEEGLRLQLADLRAHIDGPSDERGQ